MKKLIALLISAIMLFAVPVTAFAEPTAAAYSVNSIMPFYENNLYTSELFEISGSTADCISKMNGDSDIVKIVVEQKIQKKGVLWIWGGVSGASWSKTFYGHSARLANTKSGLSSGKYRLKTVYSVTNANGKTETITTYSDSKQV